MIKEVGVVVTGKITRRDGSVVPYSPKTEPHLQHYGLPDGTPRWDKFVTYLVPLYEVQVVGGSRYEAIRFGLRNHGDNRIPDRRPCDTGLSHHRVCTPTFLPPLLAAQLLRKGATRSLATDTWGGILDSRGRRFECRRRGWICRLHRSWRGRMECLSWRDRGSCRRAVHVGWCQPKAHGHDRIRTLPDRGPLLTGHVR